MYSLNVSIGKREQVQLVRVSSNELFGPEMLAQSWLPTSLISLWRYLPDESLETDGLARSQTHDEGGRGLLDARL